MILLITDCLMSLKSFLTQCSRSVPIVSMHSSGFPEALGRYLNDYSLQIAVIDCLAEEEQCLNALHTVKKRRTDVPAIFVVSSGSDHLAGKALKLGARECFRKPFDPMQFKERVSTLQKLKNGTREKRIPFSAPEDLCPESQALTEGIPKGIVKAVNFIEEHVMDRNFSIARAAGAAGMSPFHFCRTFKRHMSVTPMQFLVQKRLEMAKALLKNESGNMNISEIAAAVGFYDSSNFNKHFKRAAGVTPSVYRQAVKPGQTITGF